MAAETNANQEVKTKRDLLRERMAKKYPDQDFSDDENFAGRISDDYDDYDKRIGEYQDREKSLSDMFNADPRSAAFLTDWRQGGDPMIAMIRNFGDDFKAALEDPDKQEEIAAANKEYVDRTAKEKGFEDEYQNNLQQSLSTLDEVQKKNGMSDDQVDDAINFLVGISRDVMMGKFTADALDMAMKAINYEKDVTAAQHEGEVAGKNQKIDMQLRKGSKGDGTAASMGGSSGTAGRRIAIPPARENNSGSIWEKGGEKRITRRA